MTGIPFRVIAGLPPGVRDEMVRLINRGEKWVVHPRYWGEREG